MVLKTLFPIESRMWVLCGLLVTVAAFVCQAQTPCNYKVVCYFPNWYQYKAAPYRYTSANVDPQLCTHILYAFAKVTTDATSITRYEPNDDAMVASILSLKSQNPNLKVLLAVGGWSHGPGPFSAVAATDSGIDVWAANVTSYLRQRGLDGLDVDWEYPVGRGTPASDKQRFTAFLQRVRSAFDIEALSTGKPRLELAIAVNAGRYFSDPSYERNKIGSYVDFVSLMTYDFHGTWENQAGHHSQLYSSVYDEGVNTELNMEYAVNYWMSGGVPKEKLVLGLATYGRTFALANWTKTTPGSIAFGGGYRGDYTQESGILSYFEICQVLQLPGWKTVWLNKAKVPYAYGLRNGRMEWIGYDNEQSFIHKLTYLKTKGLGGAMVWNMASDDFNGQSCGAGNSPLIRIITQQLCSASSETTSATSATSPTTSPTSMTSPTSSVTNTATPATPKPTPTTQTTSRTTAQTVTQNPTAADIKRACVLGHWPGEWMQDPADCSSFFRCVSFSSSMRIMYTFRCPYPNLLGFDENKHICNWKVAVPGCNKK